MLQEATKAINSAFNNSFIKKLSLYLHDCVREEVQSSTFRNLKGDKDNKWIFLKGQESLLSSDEEFLRLDGSDAKLTELMNLSNNSVKDKYLIYGYLFLVGKNSKNRRASEFLTPLLYLPCHLERNGVNINCIPQEEVLSLNTGALTALMKKSDDDDEVDSMLEGLLEVVPTMPITQESMDIFLTTLKSIIPEIDINLDDSNNVDEDNLSKDDENDFYNEKIDGENFDEVINSEENKQKQVKKLEKINLTSQAAIILTKRPSVTAGVLHELTQIAEKPSGVYRETALSVINEEYSMSKEKSAPIKDMKSISDFYPVTPLALSDSQEQVIKNIENNKFIAVQGPPGTGKSQTIVNLVAHLVANGKTVLVASRMDKAVDVVADRLNALGAPFLALRAGRLNYQRQLSDKLKDLINEKIDINSDFEDSLFVGVDDMKKHIDAIRACEQKSEQIIKLEQDWTNMSYEVEEHDKSIGNRVFIKSNLKKSEIEDILAIIDTLEKNIEKTGFFANIANFSSLSKLKKILKLKDFDVNYENLGRLKSELEVSAMVWKLRKIESDIQKTGNLHVLSEQIRQMKKKQKPLAINILKGRRRESIKALLQDMVKKNRLKIHAQSICQRSQNKQNKILETEDFKPLLEAFPCWCVTTYAVSGSMPLRPGMFDVAIIDEASQCDIASCFPILFRAKRAVIVGDDKQLPHLSFLEKAKEQSFLTQYGIPERYQLMWRFRTNSMFDLADYYSLNSVMLDEHFRSLPPIIDFSNKEFYGGRIRIMKKDTGSDRVLETVVVPDGKVDGDATRNLPEIEALVKRLYDIVVEDERKNPDKPVTIGVISPFRAQVEQLKISISKVLSDHMQKKHEIEVGTAHTFQGDERDIILMSWAFAPNSFPQSLTFLQKPNLFNVAITRARYKVINFVSRDPKDIQEGLFRDYMSYIEEYNEHKDILENPDIDENIYKNKLEREIAAQIRELGHDVKAGVDIAGLSADLLVDEKFIIEVDGVEDNVNQRISNMKKQAILERCGFKVNRITFREWQYSNKACIDRVLLN